MDEGLNLLRLPSKALSRSQPISLDTGERSTSAATGGSPKPANDAKLGGFCGAITGILFIAAFVAAVQLPFAPSQAETTLANFNALRVSFLIGNILIGLAAVFAIPFYVSLRNALRSSEFVVAAAAATFAVVGIVILATLFIAQTIALQVLADAYASGGVKATITVVVAQTVIGVGGVFLFGFLLLSVGIGLYGYLAIKSRVFPSWLGYLGIVTAVLSVVSFSPLGTTGVGFEVFLVSFALLLIWIFASSVLLWRSPAPPSLK